MIPLPVLRSEASAAEPVDHAAAAAAFVADEARTDWHDAALWHVRARRDAAVAEVPEWEALRTLASQIKEHTLGHLADYLEQFEAQATANGIHVHWAHDAAEHNAIVRHLLAAHGAERVVKSKSMLTEECGLNAFLEAEGIDVVDTDLGERIMQLLEEPPSHIVMPAIHLKREEVGTLFADALGTEPGNHDPAYLTRAARRHLRERFLAADAAITGANFAVAETGGFVICTNEGNADLGIHLAPLHIASIGIEKLIPRQQDLAVFLRLLARSATGQALTVYTSHLQRPRPGAELHVVLVDNGRTAQLARPAFRASLKCIRCAACINTCPIYRRSGGHSYGATVMGPIGSVLSPGVDLKKYAALPFASTLCGSCAAVCPVQIPLDELLYRWRQEVAAAGALPAWKRWGMQLLGMMLGSLRSYRLGGWLARKVVGAMPRAALYHGANVWGRARELPTPPPQSFRAWYAAHRETAALATDAPPTP